MGKTAGSYFVKSLLASGNIAVGTTGLVFGFITWIVAPEHLDVAIKIWITISILLFYLSLITLRALRYATSDLQASPRLLRVLPAPKRYPDATALLLIEENGIFSYESLVTLYVNSDDFEAMIGIGKVVNVQANKKMQVVAFATEDSDAEWDKLVSNQPLTKKVLIKPSIPEVLAARYIG